MPNAVRRWISWAVVGGLGWGLLAGCEPVAPPQVVTPTPRPVIALVMKTLTNPFFVEMERGARRAEQELDIELLVRATAQETSVEQQISLIDELIRNHVNGIVIAPADSLRLIPVLKQAQDAGIVLVNIDNALDQDFSQKHGLQPVPFISVDNEQGAYASARYLADQWAGKGPVKVAILEGIRAAQNARDRTAGAKRAFADAPQVELVAVETANWKIEEGYRVTQQLLMQHPDVQGIFAGNDMMALGALQSLKEAQRPEARVAGFDALSEALDALKAGQLVATVDQQAAQQGYLGVLTALKRLRGEAVAPLILVDARLITAPQQ